MTSPDGPSELIVDEVRHRGAMRALAPAWTELSALSAARGPFALPEWFAVTASALAPPDGPTGLRVLLAHRDGALEGVLPLLVERRPIGGVPARVLRSLSDDHSQRFDLAARDPAAVRALWRHLAADRSWDVLELRDIPAGSEGAGLLQDLAAEAGFPVARWESQRSPYLPLPSTVEALEAGLDAKFRANLRRRAKNLAKDLGGELALERLPDGASGPEIAAALDEGFRLEQSGWKGQEGSAIACDPALRARYLALGQLFAARGELAVYFLTVGGRRVAFHFATESGGVYHLFKVGYEESLSKYGLGHLLTWHVCKSLLSRGVSELDFLGGDMEWKRAWTSQVRAHAWRYVYRPSLFGRALHAWKTRGIPLVKEAVERVKAYRSQDRAARQDAHPPLSPPDTSTPVG